MSNIENQNKLRWIPPLLILYNFCANLANDIYLPSMPKLAHLFSVNASMLQLTMTVWFAGVALPQFIFGPLTDRYGRKPILFLGGICFVGATFLCAMANNIWLLLAGRFFQGVGVCSLNVTTFSILADLFDYKKRTHILNKISMYGTLAPLIGPVIGGYILVYLGWRMNFIVILLLGGISLIALSFNLNESNRYLNPHALNIRNIYKSYLMLVVNKKFMQHLIPYCLLLGALVAYITVAPFIVINKFKIPVEYFGYTQLPIFSATILGAFCLQKIHEESNLKKALVVGMVIVIISSVIMIMSSLLFNNLFIFIAPMIFYAFGFSLCGSILTTEVMSAAAFNKGSAAALLSFGMALACMFSSLFNGLVYNGTLFAISALIFVFVLVASWCYFFALKAEITPVDEVGFVEESV